MVERAPLRATVAVAAAALLLTASGSIAPPPARASSCLDPDGPRCFASLATAIEMAYTEIGPANGPTVIFLHGGTDTVRSWSAVVAVLHDLRPDLRLIALDLRGHGQSSMPAGPRCHADPSRCFGAASMADDVVAFLDARGIATAAFAGHSMGAGVALELGLAHRSRVDRLVLVGSGIWEREGVAFFDGLFAALFEPWRAKATEQGLRWPEDVYDLTPLDLDPDAAAWMEANWVVDPVAAPELVRAIAIDAAATRFGTFLGVTSVDASALARRIHQLSTPTLALWGIQDGFFWFEPEERRLLEDLFVAAKGAGSFSWKAYGAIPLPETFVQTDDIGHAIQWEAPAQVALDIDTYLRTGFPTPDLYRTDAPNDIHAIVTEPGAAIVISAP